MFFVGFGVACICMGLRCISKAGFKGIFFRYCAQYAKATQDSATLVWLQTNAAQAWKQHNARGVVWAQWCLPTPDDMSGLTGWQAAAAVTAIQCVA